jgi:hypothetical protein
MTIILLLCGPTAPRVFWGRNVATTFRFSTATGPRTVLIDINRNGFAPYVESLPEDVAQGCDQVRLW